MRPPDRRGVTLLEVLVALTILGTAGAALSTAMRDALGAAERARAAEREMAAASAYLDVVALWPAADLDRHLGERAQGPWRITVQRPARQLYTVALADSGAGRLLLTTVLYRPDSLRARPR